MNQISTRRFAYGLAIFVAAYAVASLCLPHGTLLVGLGNAGQSLILAAATCTALLNVRRARKQGLPFWALTSFGFFLWFVSQMIWTYYESILRAEVPNAYSGDVLFFLHMVPLIAAASTQLHAEPMGERSTRFGYLDFSLLLVWWFFLYAYLVGPWQFVQRDELAFGMRYNILYAVENLTLLIALCVLWLRATSWKRVYAHLLAAYVIYGVSSLTINIAVDRKGYYTGSLYDVPLVASMAWCAYAGFLAFKSDPAPERPLLSAQAQTRWHSRLAMVALFTMPFFAAWAATDTAVGPAIQRYRLLLTLAAMLMLTLLLCFKEELLQRKLVGLLDESRRSYESLQLLQEDLLQKEKLAAIGKLVAGAAHEINNPLTAILGYSSLVADDPQLNPVQRSTIAKIMAQARRTKALVSSLLTFAKQTPMERSVLDLNTVVNNAVQLHELDRDTQNVNIVRNLHPDLPAIWGDKNHLLQACFHILDNAVEAMQEAHGKGTATLTTSFEGGKVLLRCADTGPGVADPGKIFDPFYTTKEVGKGSGLGLSACYGIVRDHGGEIKCENRIFGGAEFTLSFPPAEKEQQAQAAVVGRAKELK